MATAFAPPADYPEPPDMIFAEGGGYDHAATTAAEKAWIDGLAAKAREGNAGEYVGEVLAFPAGDGSALYMVWKHRPLTLIHLPLGDAWSITAAHLRGLKLVDVEQQVNSRKAMAAVFGRDDTWWDDQPVGTVLHYCNGFKQFVRGEVVLDAEGKTTFKPTAVVGHIIYTDTPVEEIKANGGWRHYDIAIRRPDGRVDHGYHVRGILEGKTWRPNPGCVYESPTCSSNYNSGPDPRTMPAIDPESLLTPPSEEDLASEAKVRLLREIVTIANDHTVDPDRRLGVIETMLRVGV